MCLSHGHRKINGRETIQISFFISIAKLVINVAVVVLSNLLWLAVDRIVPMGLLLLLIDHHIGFLACCATVGCCNISVRKINGREIIFVPILVVAKLIINVVVVFLFYLLWMAIDCIVRMSLLPFLIEYCVGF